MHKTLHVIVNCKVQSSFAFELDRGRDKVSRLNCIHLRSSFLPLELVQLGLLHLLKQFLGLRLSLELISELFGEGE